MTGLELFALPAALGGGSITLGTVGSVIGTAVSVIGAISGGNNQANMYAYNAAVSQNNAIAARQAAAADAARQERESRVRLGQLRARGGGSGLELMGSALDVIEDSAAEEELDRLTLLYNGDIQAGNFAARATLDTAAAATSRREGMGTAAGLLLQGAQGIRVNRPATGAATGGAAGTVGSPNRSTRRIA